MKLLVLSSWWPCPADNGSRVRAFHLVQRLARRHAVTLVAFGTPREPDEIEPLTRFCQRVIAVAPTPRPRHGLGLRGLLSPVPRFHVQTESQAMRAHARALAQAHDAALALQIGAARYLLDIPDLPRVFEEVEVTAIRDRAINAPTARARLRHRLTWWKARRFFRHIVSTVERATVVSSLEREALAEMDCDVSRIHVVPNGVDTSGPPRTGAPSARLIYPGSVVFDANLDAVRYFVRDVFPRVRQTRPDASFWVTGSTDGVDVSDLEQEGVTFTGRLPDVEPAIVGSAACIVPLRVGGGTRLKVLQAMALGVPVVSTPKGVEGLDVEPGQHVLVGRTPAELASHAVRLLDDAAHGKRLAAAAHQRARERYDWDGIAESLESVIDDAVRAHPSFARNHAGRVATVPSAR